MVWTNALGQDERPTERIQEMKRISLILILSGLACFLCGCGTYYYQEGKSFAECRADCGRCVGELDQYRDINAEEDPARYNAAYNYEGKFMDTCMKGKGYKIVSEHKLPADVRRQKPDPWNLYDRGLAGAIDDN